MEIDTLNIITPLTDTLQAVTPIPNVPSFGLMIFQMFLMLIVLSVVLYLSLYFFKRINARIKNPNQSLRFKLHENLYFSAKQGISAVSFGKKLYIIGFSGNSVNLIDIIEDEEMIAEICSEKSNEGKFGSFLNGCLRRGK